MPLTLDITTFATDTAIMVSFNYINGTTSYTISAFPSTVKKHVVLPKDYDKDVVKVTIEGLKPNTNYSLFLRLLLLNRTDLKSLLGGAEVTTANATNRTIPSFLSFKPEGKRCFSKTKLNYAMYGNCSFEREIL